MDIRTIYKYNLAYSLFPFKRSQDVIRIDNYKGGEFSVAVVDGWNNLDYLPDNVSGKRVAEFVAQEYPKKFISNPAKDAQHVAEEIDRQVLAMYPAHASCVGAFLFHFDDRDLIVAVGSVVVLYWDGNCWAKPKEIGDYSLDPKKFPSDVSTFFGRGELKADPLYRCHADVVKVSSQTPVLFASDGLEKVLTNQEINSIVPLGSKSSPKTLVSRILTEVKAKGTQNDDISVLVRL